MTFSALSVTPAVDYRISRVVKAGIPVLLKSWDWQLPVPACVFGIANQANADIISLLSSSLLDRKIGLHTSYTLDDTPADKKGKRPWKTPSKNY
jgi:hypothetical protein